MCVCTCVYMIENSSISHSFLLLLGFEGWLFNLLRVYVESMQTKRLRTGSRRQGKQVIDVQDTESEVDMALFPIGSRDRYLLMNFRPVGVLR
jgi:hypothetical protein